MGFFSDSGVVSRCISIFRATVMLEYAMRSGVAAGSFATSDWSEVSVLVP